MRIVVTGATGYVGSRLVTALLANQHEVVAASRNPERLKRLGWFDDVAPRTLDASDPVSLRAAFASAGPVDVVYYLVHGIGQPGFRDADKAAATNLAVAARDAGVRRIVYLGGFVPADEALSDVLRYLVAAADPGVVPAGAYDLSGPTTSSYRELLKTYARVSGRWHAALPVGRVDTALASLITGVALPVPQGLAEDLVESLDHPMVASVSGLRDRVPDPPGGLLCVDDAIALALAGGSNRRPKPVSALTDPHQSPASGWCPQADSDPAWAGGDALHIRRLARAITPPIARPTLRLVNVVPGPLAGMLRTGLDILFTLTLKARAA